jgi:hypothetical protein
VEKKIGFGIFLFLVSFLCLANPAFAQEGENITAEGSADNQSQQETPQEKTIRSVDVTNIIPSEFKIGDIQFSIQVQNNGNVELTNVIALVTGSGFSTYDMVPIDSLKPGEKSYIIVMGTAKEDGVIPIAVKINNQIFPRNITIVDPSAAKITTTTTSETTSKEKEELLANLSVQFTELRADFRAMEEEYQSREEENYELSGVNFNDLKGYIKNAQIAIVQKNVEQARANLALAADEYAIQKENLDSAKPIKKPFLVSVKENVGLLAGIVISISALITFYELVKKKSQPLASKLKEGVTKTVTKVKETKVTTKTKTEKKKPKAKK